MNRGGESLKIMCNLRGLYSMKKLWARIHLSCLCTDSRYVFGKIHGRLQICLFNVGGSNGMAVLLLHDNVWNWVLGIPCSSALNSRTRQPTAQMGSIGVPDIR